MNRKLTVCAGVALLGLSGLVVAQDIIPRVNDGHADVLVPTLEFSAEKAKPEGGHNFTIVEDAQVEGMNGSAVLLDKGTGETWQLINNGESLLWVVIPRVNVPRGQKVEFPENEKTDDKYKAIPLEELNRGAQRKILIERIHKLHEGKLGKEEYTKRLEELVERLNRIKGPAENEFKDGPEPEHE